MAKATGPQDRTYDGGPIRLQYYNIIL